MLKKTALNPVFHELGAKMVPFSGWEMPVQFSNIKDEHLSVRTSVGVFDVSHMGEIRISGPDAFRNLQYLTPNNVSRLSIGQAHYSSLLYPEGTFVDDILVYRLGENEFMLCVNCANTDKDYQWILENVEGDLKVENISDTVTQLAIQGPKAILLLQQLSDMDLSTISYYHFKNGKIGDAPAMISRTGYTGEDGFEIYIDPGDSRRVWNKLFENGKNYGLKPAGLGSRDTLRLEAGMPLYGNDIDNTVTPMEAGLQWTVKFKKGDFIGKDILLEQKEKGVSRNLAGFVVKNRRIPRPGCKLKKDSKEIGVVTSGSIGYYIDKTIGMGYIETGYIEPGNSIEIIIREKLFQAEIISIPFYKREK